MRKLLVIFLIMITFETTRAEEINCSNLISLYDTKSENCQCENITNSINIQSPYNGLRLTAVCNYEEDKDSFGTRLVHGEFYFIGNQTFSGVIRREYSDFVTEFIFKGEKLISINPFYESFVNLRFEDTASAEKTFKTPDLSEKSPCWEANVKINVTEILTLLGESDESGNYARKYKAIEIGKYSECSQDT